MVKKEIWTLEYEVMEDEIYEESMKTLKMKKPKKSWKEAKTNSDNKRNNGFTKKRNSR